MAVYVLMKKTVSLFLAVLLLLSAVSCTVSSPSYMRYKNHEISQSMYEYLTAYYKTRFFSSFAEYGLVTDDNYDEELWDETVDGDRKLSQQVCDYVDTMIREMLVTAVKYDEMGLGSDKEIKEALDRATDGFMSDYISAAGSRSELNSICAEYGMNINTLRRLTEYETKAAIVEDKLFGEDGEYAVNDGEREKFYENNYSRVKHILINNAYKYVTDENGDPIMDIYTGRYKTEELTEKEKAEKQDLADEILSKAKAGADFEELMKEYNEDSGMESYKDGYFVSPDTVLDTKYITAAMILKEGETVLADTSYGLMIIKKYPLEAGMWKDETNSAFFSDLDQNIIAQKKEEIYGEFYKDFEVSDTKKDFSSIPPLDGRLTKTSSE